MSKRPHDSLAPASSSDGLVERLKAAGNDAVLLREIIETNDSGSVASAFAALLTNPSSDAINDVKRRKKASDRSMKRDCFKIQPRTFLVLAKNKFGCVSTTPNRPCPSTPNETLVEIMLFADRDALDALQLVRHFMLEFIRDREAKLPLRSISRVRIGKCSRPKHFRDVWKEHWLPFVGVARNMNIKEALMPKTVSQLVPYLRLACCASVCIDLRWSRSVRKERRETASGAVFGDLVVPRTSVNLLKVHVDDGSVAFALRAFEAFKPLSKVVVKVDGLHDWASSFDEAFFTSAAECGVRSIKFETGSLHKIDINVLPALLFGFAEPTTGGARNISGVFCALEDDDFFARNWSRFLQLTFGLLVASYIRHQLSEACSPTFEELIQLSNAANVCHMCAMIANIAMIWVNVTGRSSLRAETEFALLSAIVYLLLSFALFYGSLKIHPAASEGGDVAWVECYRDANRVMIRFVVMCILFLADAWILLEAIAFDLSKLK